MQLAWTPGGIYLVQGGRIYLSDNDMILTEGVHFEFV